MHNRKTKNIAKPVKLLSEKKNKKQWQIGMIIQIHLFSHILFLCITKGVSSLLVEIVGNKVYASFLGSLYLARHRKHEMSTDSFVILNLLKEILKATDELKINYPLPFN